jgi:peptidoglycan/LPS O-acetylase OafA/YrhL
MYWIFTTFVVLAFAINPDWRLNNFDLSLWSLSKSYLILPQNGWPILGVGWTLEHEMMFYGLVALVMLHFSMRPPIKFAVAWLLIGIGVIGSLQGHGREPAWLYHFFSPYMLAFGFGWLVRCVEETTIPIRRWNVALFAVMVVASYLVATGLGELLVLRIALAALVFSGFIVCRQFFATDNRLNRIGCKFGDASYSIYLSHWFVLSAMGKVLGVVEPPAVLSGAVRVFGVVLSIAIGVFIFTLLEKPIDRWLRRSGSTAEIARPSFASLWRQNVSRFLS